MRGVVLGAVTGALISVAAAQPAPPDVDRAKDLYNSAETAMKDGRYGDAVRDYGESYELSKQPALFYKIARANEKAGKCDVALIYYARYLREGKPSDTFVTTTKERITACGGDPEKLTGAPPPPPPPHEPTPKEPAGSGSGSGSGDKGDVGHNVLGGTTQSNAGTGSGSDTLHPPTTGHKAAWLLVGTSIGLATIGGVLAYATSSSQNDIKDLYVSALGNPPQFDATTQKRYNDLIDEGHTYEKLSWVSFGLAGVAAIGAAVLFATGGSDEASASQHTTLLVSPTGAGVRVRF